LTRLTYAAVDRPTVKGLPFLSTITERLKKTDAKIITPPKAQSDWATTSPN
jgi:hypothetical protein